MVVRERRKQDMGTGRHARGVIRDKRVGLLRRLDTDGLGKLLRSALSNKERVPEYRGRRRRERRWAIAAVRGTRVSGEVKRGVRDRWDRVVDNPAYRRIFDGVLEGGWVGRAGGGSHRWTVAHIRRFLGEWLRRSPRKARRTNDFGPKYHRWFDVRKRGGWTGQWTALDRGRLSEKGVVLALEKRWEKERRGKSLGNAVTAEGVWGVEENYRVADVRDMGPLRRSGVRYWGKRMVRPGVGKGVGSAEVEGGESRYLPGEKRVRRSRSETIRMRVTSRRKHKTGGWWQGLHQRMGEVKYAGEWDVRETREARKRYVESLGLAWGKIGQPKGEVGIGASPYMVSRRRSEQQGRHARRIRHEDGILRGGMELVEKVKTRCLGSPIRTSRGVGKGVHREAAARKARVISTSVGRVGGAYQRKRQQWGRIALGSDRRRYSQCSATLLRGVWRTKEKRGVEYYMYKSPRGRVVEQVGPLCSKSLIVKVGVGPLGKSWRRSVRGVLRV